jgi:prostamide/prostaglandin F2alpha synthase
LTKLLNRFIGIGFDTRFVKPFVEGGFFQGELYVDNDKACYEALQYQRFSFWDLIKKLCTRSWLDKNSKAKSMGISGDMKGDGFQNGGALVVDKNGKQLYEYRQEDAAEHISADEILQALKISNPNPSSSSSN